MLYRASPSVPGSRYCRILCLFGGDGEHQYHIPNGRGLWKLLRCRELVQRQPNEVWRLLIVGLDAVGPDLQGDISPAQRQFYGQARSVLQPLP